MTGSTSWITAAPGRTRRTALGASVAVTALAWCMQAQALPVGGNVVGGAATISNATIVTTPTTTINQTSSRALIQWQSFNVASDEAVVFDQPSANSITFNVLPLSATAEADIEGTITAQGGVWLYSPRGIIIGHGANIDVGSFLATTGQTTYALGEGGSGNMPLPSVFGQDSIPIFGATASIDVQSGANIQASNGFVVLNSEALTQNGAVTTLDPNNGGVAYAIGDAASVSFNELSGNAGLQLTGIDTSGSNPGEPNFVQGGGGSTNAQWVGVYAPNQVEEGFTSVINMGGTTEASGVAPSGAEANAVLLVGTDAGSQNFSNDVTDVNTTGANITADTGGVLVEASSAEIGNVTANGPVTVEVAANFDGNFPTGGNLNIYGTVTDTGNIALSSLSGTVTVNGGTTVSATGDVKITGLSASVTIGGGATVQAASEGAGEGQVVIEGSSVYADPNSSIYAGKDLGDPSGPVTMIADFGDLDVGNVSGNTVTLTAGAADGCGDSCGPVGGNLNIDGPVLGTNSVFVTAYNGTIDIESNVTSGGPLNISAAGDILVGQNNFGNPSTNNFNPVILEADSSGVEGGGMVIDAGGQYLAASNSLLQGGPLGQDPTAAVSVEADGGDLTTGAINGTDVELTTDSDIFVEGPVSGSNSVTFDPANITLSANVTSGGKLDITATNTVTVDAGITVMSAGDLTIDAGTVDLDPGSLIVAGTDASDPTGNVTITAETGDLDVGTVTGEAVTLNAGAGTSITGGDILIAGNVLGTSSVSVTAYRGSVDVESNVVSGGTVLIRAAYDISVGQSVADVLIQSDNNDGAETGSGTVTIDAGGVYNAATDSEVRAGFDPANPQDAVSITAQNAGLTSGAVEGTNIIFETDNGLTLNGSVLGTSSVLLEGYEGEIPDTITIGPNVTVSSGSELSIGATGDVLADPTSLLISGTDPSAPVGDVEVLSETGNVTVGRVSGVNVTLTAGSADSCDDGCGPVGGDLNIDGAIFGTDSITATTYVGNIDIEANVISGGALTVNSAGDITVDKDQNGILIESDANDAGGDVNITAGGSYTADAGSTVQGGTDGGAPSAAVTITAEGGDLTTGMVNGTDVELATDGDLTINGAVLGTNSVTLDPANVFINANVTSGGALNIAADNAVDVAGGVTVMSAGDLTINAGSVDADPTSLLVAGTDQNNATGDVTIIAAAGSLTVGQVTGENVTLNAGTDDSDDAGDVLIGGDVLGTASVSVTAFNGAVDVEANITSGGGLAINAAKDITVDQNQNGIVIESDANGGGGAVNISAGGQYSADAGSTLQGGADPDAAVTVTADGDLTTGMVNATDVTLITPGDLTIAGAVFGTSSVSFDPAEEFPTNVFVNADVTSGGILNITATDAVDVAPDVTVMSAGALTINAQTVDADATSLLVAGTDASHPAAAVSVSASNGDLTVGQITGTTVTLTAGTGEGGGDLNMLGAIFASSEVDGSAPNGAIDVEANVIAGGPVHLTSSGDTDVGLTTKDPVLIESDSGGTGAGDIEIEAGGAYDADGSSELRGGPDPTAPTQSVSVTTDDGDMTTGIINGADVTLTTATGDDLTVNGAVFGADSVTIDPANVTFNADVTSGGALDVTATNTITVSPGVALRSDNNGAGTGNLSLTAGVINADGTSQLTAGASDSAPTANVTVISNTGDITVGGVSGDAVTLTAAGDMTVDGAVLALAGATSTAGVDPGGSMAGDGSVTITAGGDFELSDDDSITAASFVHITAAADVTLDSGSLVRSDAGGETVSPGDVTIDAKDSFFASNSSLVVGGASKTAPTAAVNITAGDNTSNEGGDLTSGPISGTTVTLNAFGGSDEELGGHGDLDIDGAILGTQGVFAYSDHGNNGTLPGATNVEADVTSGGTIDIRSEGVGNLTIGQGEGSSTVVISSSASEVYLFSNTGIFANSGARVSGVSLDATAEGTLNIASGASFATTGSTTAPVWPTAPVTVVANSGGAAPTVTSLNLAAATLNIQGAVTAGKGGTTDDIYIQALGSPALVTVGGTGAPSGFNLTSAEFANLGARNVVVEAGGGEGATHNADINLASLAIDPAKVGGLWLGTSSDHTVTVSGVVTGAGDALDIGFAEAPPNGTVLVGYIPGEIDITGSIGSTASPFASVGLLARDNIFMGASAFITAAKADPTFDAVSQSKTFTGLSQGYVFIASNTLQLGAQQRIIQQNTSTLTGQGEDQFAGLVFNAPTSASPLIADPASLSGKTIGTGGWAANYGAGPTAIDVFGLIRQSDDSVVSGVDAALQDNLLPTAIETSDSYRINSCIFGTNCSISPTNPYQNVPGEVQFQDPTDPENSNNGTDPIIPPGDGGSSAAANAANAAAGQTFLDNIVEPAASFTDTLVNGSPVTQSGNGDLWQGPNGSVGCTPTADHPCPPPGQ